MGRLPSRARTTASGGRSVTRSGSAKPDLFATRQGPLPKLPSAQAVRKACGCVEIGEYRVSHLDNWGDERYPWKLYGPCDEHGERDLLDSFPQYRQAVAAAKRLGKSTPGRA